jgi:uncharacterized protein (DUF4415 family)
MSNLKTLSPERIAEIKAFQDMDISDISELTDEQLAQMKPRHPEYFKPVKKAIQIRLDADVLAWFKGFGNGYQTKINAVLREVMMKNIISFQKRTPGP